MDIAISSIEAAKIVAANRNDYDAFILACGIDPGLDAWRQIVAQPVVGTLLGSYFLGEQITPLFILGGLLIAIGIVIASRE